MTMKAIIAKRVVPVAVIERVADAVPLAGALREGGINAIEVTLRTEAAFDAVEAIRAAFPDMAVGVGTVLEPAQVERARRVGAAFGVAPGLNEDVVRAARAAELPFIPGVLTPSEVERALFFGLRLLKFFPAEAAGGVKMLEALAGPYAHTGVKFIPLGGIHLANLSAYLALPVVAAVGGTWFVNKKQIAAGDWGGIARQTREAVAAAGA